MLEQSIEIFFRKADFTRMNKGARNMEIQDHFDNLEKLQENKK